jgi:Mor family transcriptional regulator
LINLHERKNIVKRGAVKELEQLLKDRGVVGRAALVKAKVAGSSDRNNRLIWDLLEGMSRKDVAEKYKITYTRVSQVLHKTLRQTRRYDGRPV